MSPHSESVVDKTFERERVAIERKITVNRREKNYIAFI